MPDPSPLAALKLPPGLLELLASRSFHDALQPVHHLMRLAHIVSAGGFFGAIALLDLRLLRARRGVALSALAAHAHPWINATFAVTMLSGVMLFLYDPIRVGSHAYFTPKLGLEMLALGHSLQFHRDGLPRALAADRMPPHARLAGAVSLGLWLGVMVCAGLNAEAAPRVPLW
jgi:hypothetical protein